MTQQLDLHQIALCNSLSEHSCAVLIEQQTSDCTTFSHLIGHSQAWMLAQGKPVLYHQIQHLIQCGFKKFIIALTHIDRIIKEQIDQLTTLYPDCYFKCLQIRDSWLFEDGQVLTRQAERYLQRYLGTVLKDHPQPEAYFLWIQKIGSVPVEPFQLFAQADASTAFKVKQKHPEAEPQTMGCWLNISALAEYYHIAVKTQQPCARMSVARRCVEEMYLDCPEILVDVAEPLHDSSAKQEDMLVTSRCFNQVSINPERGIVIKSSSAQAKLQQEIDFYQQLPQQLQIHFPRLVDTGHNWYALEYYPYTSLSQYLVYYGLPLEHWQTIFKRLMSIHCEFVEVGAARQPVKLDAQALYRFYKDKLDSRIDAAMQYPALQQVINMPSIRVNGNILQGLQTLSAWLDQRLLRLCQQVNSGFVHGDLCFSNILFEPASGIIRLIDPRGDFMDSVNQGDPRYDLAKILHSVHGHYDFIIHDLFTLTQQHNDFELRIPTSATLEQLKELLFEHIRSQTDYPVNDLILLESLLFLTMLPLHNDHPQRQMAFLLTGLTLLNQVYQEENSVLFTSISTHLPPISQIQPSIA